MNTLKELIEAADAKVVLDLSEMTLAGREVATSLAGGDFKGIELRKCPAFLRGWIDTEQERSTP